MCLDIATELAAISAVLKSRFFSTGVQMAFQAAFLFEDATAF